MAENKNATEIDGEKASEKTYEAPTLTKHEGLVDITSQQLPIITGVTVSPITSPKDR